LFGKEGTMVRLYKYSRKLGRWVLVDYGVQSKTDEYVRQGFVVIY
jgi:hypothetical protein